MSNRQQRRKEQREAARAAQKVARPVRHAGYQPVEVMDPVSQMRQQVMVKQHIKDMLEAGGITTKDLDAAYDKGLLEGFQASTMDTVTACYAAFCLALNDLHGFGMRRCHRVLKLAHEKMTLMIDSRDLVEEVYRRMKLEIELKTEEDGTL